MLNWIMNESGFVPRRACGDWTPALIWLHLLADAGIIVAYFGIPVLLLYYVHRKKARFRSVYYLFAAFILCCGATHATNLLMFFYPAYRLDGLVRAACAVVSLATLATMLFLIPHVVTLKTESELEQQVQTRTDELNQSNELLQEAVASRDQFMAILSHELRNPLAPLRTAVHILKANYGRDQTAATLDMIDRQTGVMDRIITDLIDVQRLALGRIRMQKKVCDLQRVVRVGVEAGWVVALNRGVDLVVYLPKKDVLVFGDWDCLQRIVSNVVLNAAKFTRPGGHVRVTIAGGRDDAKIVVADDGIGVAEDHVTRVFEPFFQADQAIDRQEGGLGVGLTISRRLVEAHQGTITLESPGPGRGTTVTIRLPTRGTPEPPAVIPVVVIADDNIDTAESLALCLRVYGFQVVPPAYNGQTALEKIVEFRPGIVLLDINMPELDGCEVARRVKTKWPATVVIAITGHGDAAARERGKDAGFDHYLVKPVDPKVVARILQGLDNDPGARG